MTTFDGDAASEPEDTADTAASVDVIDESDTDVAPEPTESSSEESGAEVEVDEDADPAATLKAQLRREPGEWYVIHSYAGYENKVKANLQTRVQNLDVGDYIFQIEVPTEEVTEIKNGQRKQVNRKVLPGYILVEWN